MIHAAKKVVPTEIQLEKKLINFEQNSRKYLTIKTLILLVEKQGVLL